MRGVDHQQDGMFSYLSPEERVRPDHPLRGIRRTVDEILRELSPLFGEMYSLTGAFNPTREVVAGAADSNVVLDP